MKMFALTAAAVTGLLCSAISADAQYRYRNSGVYVAPSYGYTSPIYTYPTYNSSSYLPVNRVPGYTGLVGVGTYTPLAGTTIITPASYSSPVYNSGFYNPSYSSPVYGSSFTSPVYNGYNSGIYIAPIGGNMRSRGWRY